MKDQNNTIEQSATLKEESAVIKTDKILEPQEKRLSESNIFEIIKRYDTLINLANQKASFLIGSAGIVLIAAIVEKNNILISSQIGSVLWLNDLLYFTAVISLLGVLACSFLVVLPLTKSPANNSYISCIAYSSVAKLNIEYFKSKLSSPDYDFWSDLVIQTHQLAIITANKFKILKIASMLAFALILSIAILFIMMVIK